MRVFIAWDLPEEYREKVVEVQKKIKYVRAKLVEPENLHITFGFLKKKGVSNLSESDVKKVKRVLENLPFKSFKIRIKGILLIPNRNFVRVIALDVKEGRDIFIEIQKYIEKELKKFNIESSWHEPHLTLMRVKSIDNREKFLKSIEEIKDFELGTFEIKEIKIKKSTLTPKGPIYEDLFVRELP